jgi:hypothetical protein
MLSLVLLLAAGQSPSATPKRDVAVLVSRRIGMTPARADAIAELIVMQLVKTGHEVLGPARVRQMAEVMGMKDPATCDAKRACVSGLARVLQVPLVISVDTAFLESNLALHLEVIDANFPEPRATADRVGPERALEGELTTLLVPILKAVGQVSRSNELQRPADPPPQAASPSGDTPKQVALEPQPTEPHPGLEKPAREPGSPIPGVLVAVGAAAAGVTSIALLAAGLTEQQALQAKYDASGATPVYHLTAAEAQGAAGRANTNFSASLGTAIGAGALTLVAIVLFAAR